LRQTSTQPVQASVLHSAVWLEWHSWADSEHHGPQHSKCSSLRSAAPAMTQQRCRQLLSSYIHQLSHTMIHYSFCHVPTQSCLPTALADTFMSNQPGLLTVHARDILLSRQISVTEGALYIQSLSHCTHTRDSVSKAHRSIVDIGRPASVSRSKQQMPCAPEQPENSLCRRL